MGKLNQIIAVAQSKKKLAQSVVTQAYKTFQRSELFGGIERTYQPINDEGEIYPPESVKVQFKVEDVLSSMRKEWEEMVDIVATNDAGNTLAKANVEIDGKTLLQDVPVTTLIFLEKQLQDLTTLVNSIPVLNTADDWKKNSADNLFESDVIKSHKTKKEQKPLVLFPATPEHPAQTQIITEDVLVGYWNTKKISGAVTNEQKQDMVDRVVALKDAVIKAREEANSTQVEHASYGRKILDFLYKGSV